MLKVMGEAEPTLQKLDHASQRAAVAFKQEQLMAAADTEQQFNEEPTHYPLGEVPVLLANIAIGKNKKGHSVLRIHDKEGRGINIEGGHKLMHYLYNALGQVVDKIGWEIPLARLGQEAPPPPEERLN